MGYFRCVLLAVAVVAMASISEARLDHGGWMSRELAVGAFDDSGTTVETVYATTLEDGVSGNPPSDDAMTLWAFCPPYKDTGHPAEGCLSETSCPVLSPEKAAERACAHPCKWRARLAEDPDALPLANNLADGSGPDSFAPPAVNTDGDRIYVVTDEGSSDGRIFSFDNCGDQRWWFDPPDDSSGNDSNKGGFYARPVVHDTGSGEPVVIAVNFGASNKAHLHAVQDVPGVNPLNGPATEWLSPGKLAETPPVQQTNYPYQIPLSKVRYGPILDTECEATASWSACSEEMPRVYLASENTGKGMLAYDIHPDDPDCAPAGASNTDGYGPCLIWCSAPNDVTDLPKGVVVTCNGGPPDAYRLGGTIVRDVKLRDGPPAVFGDILVSHLADGMVAHHLDECLGCSPAWGLGKVDWALSSLFINDTHRSIPTLSVNEREPLHVLAVGSDPEQSMIYSTTRTGAALNQLYVMRPGPASAVPGVPALHLGAFYPKFGDPGVGTSSYSWAVPNPTTGHLFYGGATDSGIHRVNRNTVDNPLITDELEAVAEWFDYIPPNAWRTAPAYSGAGKWLHIGSAEARFYNLNPDGRKGQALACFDARDGTGSACLPGKGLGIGVACCDDIHGANNDYLHLDANADDDLEIEDLPCREDENTYFDCSAYSVFFAHPVSFGSASSIDFATVNAAGGWNSSTQTVDTLVVLLNNPNNIGVTGEVANETTGQYRTMTVSLGWASAIPLKEGVDNELRYALFDEFGNETSRRLTITNVPDPLP